MTWIVVIVCLAGGDAPCSTFRSTQAMTAEECEANIDDSMAYFARQAQALGGAGMVRGYCVPSGELL